ncbi:MAG: hypothetical protein QM655_15120 [Nocardioidaceae bacterium]
MATSSPSQPATGPVTGAAAGSRRRQRSVRVTVAVGLLSLATIAVLVAVPAGSFGWLAAAAVFALVCAWAAARIVHNELAQSRRENAADRARQAAAYRGLFADRAEEHAAFASAMTDKLVRSDREVTQLSGTLVQAERRAAEAERRVQREAQRAQDLQAKVSELVAERDQDDQQVPSNLAQFQFPYSEDFEVVADLMTWEDKVAAASVPDQIRKQA